MTSRLLERLRSETKEMLELLDAIVSVESPTDDVPATVRCAEVVAELGSKLLGQDAEVISSGGRPHLRWRFGNQTRVLIAGHFDTVWPIGTVTRWPFSVEGDRATGPGIFDMKAGLVQGLFAVRALGSPDGVEILFNSDEEIGSPTSRDLYEESAQRVKGALVLEPSYDGSLKVARKGALGYEITIEGKAAHAGLEPDKGANSLIELAYQVLAVEKIARPDLGTTVTPTISSAGTARNTVPAKASFYIDARARTVAEQQRVDSEIRELSSRLEGTRIAVDGGIKCPPFMESASQDLFPLAEKLSEELGFGPLGSVEVGGASDGNYIAAVGTPTLDGLGAVGDGAHAEGEHIIVPAMGERAALVARLIEEIRS